MSSVLACDPDALEATARTMRRLAAELDAVAGEVATAAVQDWGGLAALEQDGRRHEAGDLLRSFVPQVDEVATGITRVAEVAREEGAAVRQHVRLGEQAASERARTIALGPPPDPVAAARWELRVEELGASQRWHESLVVQAQHRFDQVQALVTATLDRIRAAVPEPLADVLLLRITVEQTVKLARAGQGTVSSVATTRRLRRLRGRVGERTLHQVQQRVEKNLARLKLAPPAWAEKVPGVRRIAAAVGKAAPVLVLVDAVPDAVDGGGYSGWRGGATRVLAGAAVVGTFGAVVLAAPAAATIGLGAAATYQVWAVGNTIYDDRREIGQALSRTWKRGSRGFSQFRRRAADGLARLNGESRTTVERPVPQPVAPGTAPIGASA